MTSQSADREMPAGQPVPAEQPVSPVPGDPAGAVQPSEPGQAVVEAPGPVAAGAPAAPAAAPALPAQHKIRRTRIGGAWTAAAGFAVVLLLLLIFILEN